MQLAPQLQADATQQAYARRAMGDLDRRDGIRIASSDAVGKVLLMLVGYM